MTKKRILIATGIYPPDIGGPATYSKILLEELPKRDIEAVALSYGERQKNEPPNIQRISRRIPKGIRHLIYFMKILALGKNADIIFAQDPVSAGLPAALAAFFLRKKFVIKIVGDYAWEQGVQRFGVKEVLDDFLARKYSWRIGLLRKAQQWSAYSADKVIVPSDYLRKVVMRWGISRARIEMVRNSFPLPINFNKLGERNYEPDKMLSLKDKVAFKNKEKNIFSVGRLVPWKGFDVLIDVYSDLIKDFPNLKLYIIGSGPDEKKLKSKILNQKFKENVIFIDSLPRQELLRRLFAADAFVLNTAYEGFSHLVFEAMALGVPVVTTKVGGNPEIVRDRENGFLVDFNDKEALYKKIVELLDDPFLASRFSDNGRFTVAQLSKEQMINNTARVLLEP